MQLCESAFEWVGGCVHIRQRESILVHEREREIVCASYREKAREHGACNCMQSYWRQVVYWLVFETHTAREREMFLAFEKQAMTGFA